MFYLGGDDWLAWSRRLYPQLIESQISRRAICRQLGPVQPVPDNRGLRRKALRDGAEPVVAGDQQPASAADCESVPQVAERTLE